MFSGRWLPPSGSPSSIPSVDAASRYDIQPSRCLAPTQKINLSPFPLMGGHQVHPEIGQTSPEYDEANRNLARDSDHTESS
ncbi:hypothetical protein EGJ07_18675 [Stutzerimonas stutzeri]|nr:hypothetical protein EGJ07_18675 [Stutzerimonas stutzeri]